MTAAQPTVATSESQFDRCVCVCVCVGLILDKKITFHSRTTDSHNVSNKGRPSSVNSEQFVASHFLPFLRKGQLNTRSRRHSYI